MRWVAICLLLAPVAARAQATVTYLDNPPPAFDWRRPTPAEWALLGVTVGLIATDIVQTRAFLRDGRSYETNPLLGEHPSPLRLYLTTGIATVALGVLWWNLPSPWRSAVLVPVLGFEGWAVVHNATF